MHLGHQPPDGGNRPGESTCQDLLIRTANAPPACTLRYCHKQRGEAWKVGHPTRVGPVTGRRLATVPRLVSSRSVTSVGGKFLRVVVQLQPPWPRPHPLARPAHASCTTLPLDSSVFFVRNCNCFLTAHLHAPAHARPSLIIVLAPSSP